jgi:hypothetical protein
MLIVGKCNLLGKSLLMVVLALMSPAQLKAQDGSGVTLEGTGTGLLPGDPGYQGGPNSDPWNIPGIILSGLNSQTGTSYLVGVPAPGSLVPNHPHAPELEVTATDLVSLPESLDFAGGSTLDLPENTSALTVATIDITGNLVLDNTDLVVTDLAQFPKAFAGGTVLDIINYTGTETGNFVVNGSDIPDGGDFQVGQNTFQINYAAGDPSVTLTAESVPEPSEWLMLTAGMATLIYYRRARRFLSGAKQF